jgi:hypothetical protein
MAEDIDGVHFVISDFDACRIGVGVDLGSHLQACIGGRGGDQLDDGLVADEWLAAPILCDEREQAMLDLVPFAGARRQMADRDRNAEFVGQVLQLALPKADADIVAAAAIGGDQKFCRVRIARAPHRLPPAANGVDREACRVFVDADTHPAGIVGNVINAVGRRPTELRDDEVVHTHRLGLPLRTVLTAAILEIADQLLLLGIDRNRRLPRGQRLLHLSIDVPKLGIAVGMVRPLAGLAVGLKAVPQVAQKIGHHIVTNTMAELTKPGRQVAQAFGSPQQRRPRIATRRRFYQVFEIGEQRRIRNDQRPASATLPADPIGCRVGLCLAAQLRQSAVDRAARYAPDPRDRRDSATPRGQRLSGCKPTSPALIQHRVERRIAQFDRRIVNHPAILYKLRVTVGIPRTEKSDSVNDQRALSIRWLVNSKCLEESRFPFVFSGRISVHLSITRRDAGLEGRR